MTPIQFAVATLWVFYGLGAIIALNVESALKARNVGITDRPRFLGIAEMAPLHLVRRDRSAHLVVDRMTAWTRTDEHGITGTFTYTPDQRGNVTPTAQEVEGLMRAGGWIEKGSR